MSVKPIRPDIELGECHEKPASSDDDSVLQSAADCLNLPRPCNDEVDDDEIEDTPVRTLQFGDEDDDPEHAHAFALTSPHIGATLAIADLNKGSYLGSPEDLTSLATLLKFQSNSKAGGTDALKSQTKTLDAMFNSLISQAANSDQLDVKVALFNLALKAQSQCRATSQTISDIHQPKIANIVKQANIAGGHQQVNNAQVNNAVEVNESEIPPTKLIE